MPTIERPREAEEPRIPDKSFNVQEFGASGDGVTDDTAAIQRGIDAVAETGGGRLYFPAGEYRLSIDPETKRAVVLRSGVELLGKSAADVRLKLLADQSSYRTIFEVDRSIAIHDVSLRNMTLDQNGMENLVPSLEDLYPKGKRALARFMVVSRNATRMLFDGVTFTNILGVNVLNIGRHPGQPSGLHTDLIIRNCRFEQIGWSEWDFDHSTIYTQSDRVLIASNVFRSRYGAGTLASRAAIETHGADHTVVDNDVDGFTIGINATGAKIDSPRHEICGNKVTNVARGIYLWSFDMDEVPAGTAPFRDVVVHRNVITLNPDAWLASSVPSRANIGGILTNRYSKRMLSNVEISENDISTVNYEKAKTDYEVKPNEGGIVFSALGTAPEFVVTDARVVNNRIDRVLGPGIASDLEHFGELVITGNTIINPLLGGHALDPQERAAILISSPVENANISDNEIQIDSEGQATAAIVTTENCEGSCTVAANHIAAGETQPVALATGWNCEPSSPSAADNKSANSQ